MRDFLKIIFLICLGILCAQVEPASHKKNEIPIVLNSEVKNELKFQMRPANKKHLRMSFKRMKKYEKMILKKLAKYNLPKELLAVPLVESGYENIHSEYRWGSGIWMFITPTAKAHGLKISGKVDERMDVEKSTDAALRYFKANYKIFKDWHLTILAYNVGENKVLKMMKKAKTKDAWKIDNGYLAKVMAMMIISKEKAF